jgi:hypothetical protein
MGMDVYGKNPKSEVGTYFRRNVWGWHPLWEYVENQHPEIAELVKYAHSNDGDGLGARNSKKLAKILMEDFTSGKVAEYVAERNKQLAELPFEECRLCEGSGIRTDEIGKQAGQHKAELPQDIAIIVGRTTGTCNGCSGIGKRESWETNYYLEPDDVKEFADFLAECGGFEIW